MNWFDVEHLRVEVQRDASLRLREIVISDDRYDWYGLFVITDKWMKEQDYLDCFIDPAFTAKVCLAAAITGQRDGVIFRRFGRMDEPMAFLV